MTLRASSYESARADVKENERPRPSKFDRDPQTQTQSMEK